MSNPRDRRCAREAQAVAEEYLRAGGAAALAGSRRKEIGQFVRLEGRGYSLPTWNIQGYHFLDLRRRARFEHGVIPIRIIAKGGYREPEITGNVICVFLPELRG